ncbi:MAG: hypothetical protein OXI90_04555 [Gammaproteobacteria bacterium]|nr:hypothetical protein [Gammaproteobacteria bacterium]
MSLRESAKNSGQEADLKMVTGSTSDGGVPHGELLVELSDAVAGWRWDEVAVLRPRGCRELGPQATSDAILVASGFNGITRVADAIGIRLDPHTAEASVELRENLGLNAFAPQEKW